MKPLLSLTLLAALMAASSAPLDAQRASRGSELRDAPALETPSREGRRTQQRQRFTEPSSEQRAERHAASDARHSERVARPEGRPLRAERGAAQAAQGKGRHARKERLSEEERGQLRRLRAQRGKAANEGARGGRDRGAECDESKSRGDGGARRGPAEARGQGARSVQRGQRSEGRASGRTARGSSGQRGPGQQARGRAR